MSFRLMGVKRRQYISSTAQEYFRGVDAAHNASPASNIKRSEVAVILTRMMDSAARIEFDME